MNSRRTAPESIRRDRHDHIESPEQPGALARIAAGDRIACILKPPANGCGVVTLTTQERDRFVLPDPDLRKRIEALKDRWLVGLHHNWHDYEFRYDPLFDFSMAGEEDLREIDGRPFPLVPLDACNFCPPEFMPGGDKFWDLLFVAHPVFFKRVPVLFDTMRELFDRGHEIRALHICPMPPFSSRETRTVVYDVRERYESMFDEREQKLFTLLTTDFRYPFPFDLPTLAHFYRSSRVFIHTADQERRCRVAAYAWATGLPVVAMASVGSVLPPGQRRAPWFYEVGAGDSYADQVEAALACATAGFDAMPGRSAVSAEHTLPSLERHLRSLAEGGGRRLGDRPIVSQALDIRLGRHHGVGHNRNSVPQTVADFVRYLEEQSDEAIAAVVAQPDPEEAIAALPTWQSSWAAVEAGLHIETGPGTAGRLLQRVVGKSRLLLRQAGLTRP
jgi:glycosyltransferase involved in cell wall biosynthesis